MRVQPVAAVMAASVVLYVAACSGRSGGEDGEGDAGAFTGGPADRAPDAGDTRGNNDASSPPGDAGCAGDDCPAGCEDACGTEGETTCIEQGVAECGDHDADDCLEWGPVTACTGETTCSNGACSDQCSDECVMGEAMCMADSLRSCGQHDADDCLDWGASSPCGPLQICQAGSCMAQAAPLAVISEVLVNSAGSPDIESFVELHGTPRESVTGLVLVGVAGLGGADYVSILLTGNFGDDGVYVVAHPSASATTLAAADMTTADIDLRNGPDNLQLRWGATVVDALGYGDFSAAIFAGEGDSAVAPGVDQSVARDGSYTDTDDNRGDFSLRDNVSPGLPNPPANFAPTATLSCPNQVFVGDEVVLDASGSNDMEGGLTYQFSFADGSGVSSNQAVINHVYSAADVYEVSLLVVDEGNLSRLASCTIAAVIDPCANVDCSTPQPSSCLNAGTLRVYSAGVCNAGQCEYGYVDTQCPGGCAAESCQAPACGGGTCDSPPADSCAGIVLTRHPQFGTCDAGTCQYLPDSIECAQGCFIDDCVTGSDRWETPSIGTSDFHDAHVVVDAIGRPHIVYCLDEVAYRTRDSSGWHEITVDGGVGGAGCRVSIALDSSGAVHIGYFDPVGEDLRYAVVTAGVATPEMVANLGNVGRAVSVSINDDDEPQLVYLDGYAQELVMSVRSSGVWSTQTIDNWSQTTQTMDSQQYGFMDRLQVLVGGAEENGEVALYERVGDTWSRLFNDTGLGIGPRGLVVENEFTYHMLLHRYGSSDTLQTLLDGYALEGIALESISVPRIRSLHMRPGGNLEAYHVIDGRLSTDDRRLWPRGSIWPTDNASAIATSYVRSDNEQWALHVDLSLTTAGACIPDCMGRICGDDKCGGTCGDCDAGSFCSPAGACGYWQYDTTGMQYSTYVHNGRMQEATSDAQREQYIHMRRENGATRIRGLGIPREPSDRSATAMDESGELFLAVRKGSTVNVYPTTSGGPPRTYDLPVNAVVSSMVLWAGGGDIDLFYQLDGFGDPAYYRTFHLHDDGNAITQTEVMYKTLAWTGREAMRDVDGYYHLVISRGGQVRHATNRSGIWTNTAVANFSAYTHVMSPDGATHYLFRSTIDSFRAFYGRRGPDGDWVTQDITADVGSNINTRDIAYLPDGRVVFMIVDVAIPLYVRATDGAVRALDLGLAGAETMTRWNRLFVESDGSLHVFYDANIGGARATRRAFTATLP